jgi:hypothetical protein
MTIADQIKFHSDRAVAELDLALAAGTIAGARAHLELSAMHVERIKLLAPPPSVSAAAIR